METATVKSFNELISTIIAVQAHSGELWWRGQAGLWDLVASVHRCGLPEQGLVIRFMQKAYPRYHDCPRVEDRIGWLFLMQHYGLPTRLLDWTESPLVAAFFACSDTAHKAEEGAIWGFSPFLVNEAISGRKTLFLEDDRDLIKLVNAPFISFYNVTSTPGEDGTPVVVEAGPRSPPTAGPVDLTRMGRAEIPPTAIETFAAINSIQRNPRMLAQSSRFTIHADGRPMNKFREAEVHLVKITIPASVKGSVLEFLRALGITRSSLFPDLENLAMELKGLKYVAP